MADLTKFLSLSGLKHYDELIKVYIADKVAGHLLFQLADKLEDITEPKNNVIYLVPNAGETQNVKDEFMWIDGKWELIGTTSVDLSGYYTKVDADKTFETIVNADLVRGRVSGLETRMTTAEGTIAEHTTAIANVYTKEEVDGLIDGVNGAADDLAGRVTTAEGAITDLQGVVANKADQSALDTQSERLQAEVKAREALAERVTTAEGEIDALQEAVANVYTKNEVFTKEEVNDLIDGVNNSASILEGRVEANEGAISDLQEAVATKAAQADLTAEVEAREALAERVTTAEGEIDALQEAVATKAAQADLTAEVEAREALAERVTTAEGEIDALQEAVADVYTKDEVDGKVATINDEIAKKANAADVYTKDEVDGKVATINATIDTKANADDVYTKSEVYTKEEVDAMVITDAEIDGLFATANA